MARNKVRIEISVDDKGSPVIRQFAGQTEQRFERLESKTSQITRKIGQAWKLAFATVGTVAAAAFAKLTVGSIEAADAIGKTADKVGVGTEALQEYRFAASQAGVEQRTLDMGLQRFTRRVAEAAQGKGELIKVLEQYNIAVRDSEGNTRATEDVLNDLADTISRTRDPAERLRISFKAFDSEGAALVNMLSNGSAGLEETRRAARDLGLVMEDRLIRNAEAAADGMDQLSRSVRIVLTKAFVSLAPAIQSVVDGLLDLFGLSTRASEIRKVTEQIERLEAEIAELENPEGFRKLDLALNEFMGEKTETLINNRRAQLQEFRKELEKLLKPTRREDRDDGTQPSPLPDPAETDKRLEKALQAAQDYTELESEAQEISLEQWADYNLQMSELSEKTTKKVKDDTKEMAKSVKSDMQTVADSSQYVLASGITSAFTDIIDGSKDAKEAFSDFTVSVLRDIEKLLIFEFVAKKLAGAVVGGLTGGGEGGGGGGSAPTLIQAQHGLVADRPTVAMFGEAGPEAAMPLVRTSSGDLGVRSEGGGGDMYLVFNVTAFDDVAISRWWIKNQHMIEGVIIDASQRGSRPLRSAVRTLASG